MGVLKKIFILLFKGISKIFYILKYPRRILKKYKRYNGAISEMFAETRDRSFARIRTRNSLLINAGLYLPIFLGIFLSFLITYSHNKDYKKVYYRLKAPIYQAKIIKKIKVVQKRINYAIKNNPIRFYDFIFIIIGYSITFINAYLMSLNTAFDEEEKIKEIFEKLGYLNQDGYPWDVTWTPEAIMITSFNNDPYQLYQNNKLWSSLNFSPANPKVFKNNMNRFILYKRYELPDLINIEYRGEDYAS